MASEDVWGALMRECPTLGSWNRFILPIMKQETRELKIVAVAEAKRRGYEYSKQKGLYE
jgi:hypothetical protein